MHEILNRVMKADQCAQYFDDIGIAASLPEHLIINLGSVFECIQKPGLKLNLAKCHYGKKEGIFLGITITPIVVTPQK